MKKTITMTIFITTILVGCGDRLSADQISKMTEEQIHQVTPEQVGKMTPGELQVYKDRKSFFISERTKAELKRAYSAKIKY